MLPFEKNQLILESIIKYSFDEIFVTDAEGHILYVSDRFKDLFGIDPRDILQQSVFALEEKGVLSPSVTGKVLQSKKGESIIQETKRGRKLVVSAYPIFDENGQLQGALSFSRDITELDYLKKTNHQVAELMAMYEKEIEKIKK